MYGIWDFDAKDWVREMPSKVDDGGVAVLAFATKRQACERAAQHFAYQTYSEAKITGWCVVRLLCCCKACMRILRSKASPAGR